MALAFTAVLAQSLPVWAAESIQGMDFVTTPGQTSIVLHSDHNVPYQTVQTASDKIIIDLDNVNAQDSIETFFKGSGNINHVILQPMSQTKLRIIVKGEDLGTPSIGFDRGGETTQSAAPASDTLDHQTQQALHDMEDSGTSAATYNPQTLGNANNGMNDATNTTAPNAATNTSANNNPPAANTAAPIASAPQSAPEPQTTGNTAIPVIQHADSPAANASIAKPAQPLDASLPIPLADIAKYGVVAALLLGFAIFIKRKVDSLRNANASFDTLMHEHEQGKAVSFQELASAYRNDSNTGTPRTLKPYGSKGASPIGLSRLSAEEAVENQKQNQRQNQKQAAATRKPRPGNATPAGTPPMTGPSLQQMQQRLAAASRNNIIPDKMQTPAPAKQAINQYAKAKQPAAPAKKTPETREFKSASNLEQNNNGLPSARNLANAIPKRTPQNLDDLLKSEQARVQDVKQQLGVKTPQQRLRMPQGNAKSGPLPDNPAVLNFLKDVADRIEKEGKPGLAKSIQKGMDS